MADTHIEITCPRCKHVWRVDVEELKRSGEQIIYRGDKAPQYRVRCPNDYTWVIVDVIEEEGNDA